MKRSFWMVLCVLAVAGAWLLWPSGHRPSPVVKRAAATVAPAARAASVSLLTPPANALPKCLVAGTTNNISAKTNPFAFRLANTAKTIGQLASDRHAILLDNALIETDAKTALKIPAHLRAAGDPGAYLVQARGVIGADFRAALAGAGGQIVSYIPNNAYLVQMDAAGAGALAGNPLVQAVLPYDPYYKVQSSLLGLAVNQQPLPDNTYLTLGLFSGKVAATEAQIQNLGGVIVGTDRSPFGPIVHVQPPDNWIALAQLPGVQIVEPAHRRVSANDLSRQTLGVALNSVTSTNYLNLTGTNVLVEVNDTGIDTNHPDLAGRVFLDAPGSGYDTDGHGTFVAGQIAGSGLESTTVTNAEGSILTNSPAPKASPLQFRGMAPAAHLFSVGGVGGYEADEGVLGRQGNGGNDTNVFTIGQNFFLPGASIYELGVTNDIFPFFVQYPDWYLQEAPAVTNALISNNSWVNEGDNQYDLAAAGYDAAVRDALPEVTGPQPVLFVFAAGNGGGGFDNGGGGNPDTISSPATAKNVITVGALEQQRDITNTYLPFGSTNPVEAWYAGTDSSSEVASFSARGNVGIGTEGTYGRFKPDVVAPGTFVISTRSTTWDTTTYYNPTNYYYQTFSGLYGTLDTVATNTVNSYSLDEFGFTALSNVISISIQVIDTDPAGLTNMPIYVSLSNAAPAAGSSDYSTGNSTLNIPADTGAGYLTSIFNNNGDFYFSVGNPTNVPVTYDVLVTLITTNDMGDYFMVLSNLNNSLGPWYRYESGTSMAAADVSGVLALMQDFFTNTLHTVPSPALLKAMLINGARPTGFYNLQVNNTINYEGWGLVNLPNSVPATLTNSAASTNNSVFFVDQNLTNALATGDTRTYTISVPPATQALPLRITLAWTDPPGNPAAALKLVNNLSLIVTNTDSTNVYFGNDIETDGFYNNVESATNPAVLDNINNVQNVFLPPHSGTNFTIVVSGTAVNVNAVTTQTNDASGNYAPNITQDYALVISSGNGSSTNGFSVTATSASSNPTGDQRLTVVVSTNAPLMNQTVGASSPVMSTNTISFAAATSPYVTNALLTIGQTNQWHFYVVTNNGPDATYTNAAFAVFLPDTLAIPRQGVFAGTDANSTRPEADIDLFVASGLSAGLLTNLNQGIISNCVSGPQVGASTAGVFYASALGRGGSEFIVDSNSIPGQVYYIGVQSEDQMAAEYDFLPEFSNVPFSELNSNGDETVTFFPVEIPDGDANQPGYTNTIGLAIFPVELQRVVATNDFIIQNGGDVAVALSHSTAAAGSAAVDLVSHFSTNVPGTYELVFDDSGRNDITNSQPSAGPGSLGQYVRQQGEGIWNLHAADDAPAFVGSVGGSLFLEKHQDPTKHPITVTVQGNSWFYTYVTVPVGYTNLTVFAVDENPNPPIYLTLAVQLGADPTLTDNLGSALLNIPDLAPPGLSNSISIGPPLTPGVYYIGIFNPDTVAHTVEIGATLGLFTSSAVTTLDYDSTGPVPLLDDAVNYAYMDVTNHEVIQGISIGLRVDHPRISDLVFHLISPDGTRYLLMENRGAQSTNGCGVTIYTTNVFQATANGTAQPNTNVINTGSTSNIFPITYNFYTAPDEMTIYYGTTISTNSLIYDTGVTNNQPYPGGPGANGQDTIPVTINVPYGPTNGIPASTYLTIIMDQFLPTNRPDAWTYSAGGVETNFVYLAFTEDTNLTTTPIKFAPPPFVPFLVTNVTIQTNITYQTNAVAASLSSFDSATAGDYLSGSAVDGWSVASNQVSVVNDQTNAQAGSQFLTLANGSISRTLATVPGSTNTLTFAYRGPGIVGLWRGENNANDSIYGNNGAAQLVTYTAGEVGQGFVFVYNFSPPHYRISVADKPIFALTNSLSIDGWINTAGANGNSGVILWRGDCRAGYDPYSFQMNGDNTLAFVIEDASGGGIIFNNSTPLANNQWYHVAATLDGNTGLMSIYINGVLSAHTNTSERPFGALIPAQNPEVGIGNVGTSCWDYVPFNGKLDEVSLYSRALSASEVKAIYSAGSAGKFDSGTSFPQNLAKSQITLAGITTNIVFGANTNWQTNTITFVATTNATQLQLTGLEPGMLLDTFAFDSGTATTNLVTNTVVTFNNLYYQPEQDISGLAGKRAYGTMASGHPWQLEVLDNRASATNATGTLLGWQLAFTFANTNLAPGASAIIPLIGGIAQTNNNPTSGITWYSVTVPTNASFATNIIDFASAPVNLWFSTNYPPTTTNPPADVELLASQTNGSSLLTTNGFWPYFVPGQTYYLGVQNASDVVPTFAIEVDFDHGNAPGSGLPQVVISRVKVSAGSVQLSWPATNSAQYEVQWKTNLTAAWLTITNPATTTTNGVATFSDNGAQTAPLGPMRFYRLVQMP